MKIAVIVPSLANKGTVNVARSLFQIQVEKNAVDFYYFDKLPTNVIDNNYKHLSYFNNVKWNNYDIIHSHSFRPNLYCYLLMIFFTKPKYITTIHNFIEFDLSDTYNKLISTIFTPVWLFLYKKMDSVAVLNNSMKKYYLEKGLKDRKVFVIPNGVKPHVCVEIDPSDANKINDLKRNYTLLGAYGYMFERKGFEQIILALPHLENYALLLIGGGSHYDVLVEMVKDLKLNDRVIFLSFRENVRDYIPFFDIFLIPSRSEGFPLALLEAAAACIPSIVSNIDVFQESFDNSEVVFFELDNTNSFVSAINHISSHMQEFSVNLHKKYLSNYSDKIMYEKYMSLYANALSM